MMLDPAREAGELEVEMRSLRRSREDVEAQIRELEGLPGKEVRADVKKWMEEVVQVDRQVSELLTSLRSYSRWFRLLCCCCYLCNYELAEEIRKKKAAVKVLQDEHSNRGGNIAITKPPERVVNLPGYRPKFVVGMEENVSRVFEQLKDPEVDVIGICGMGGSGKTTLAKEITRRLGLPEPAVHFDLVILVVVSQTPNISKIQEDIGVRLGSPSLPSNQSERATFLSRLLSEKRFLLILDDVWKKLDLGDIGVPQSSQNESKILLTTRELNVCSDMGCKEPLSIGRLGEDDSRELFRKIIGKEDLFSSSFREIAEDVVRKCGGLPLVITTVARAFTGKKTKEGWEASQKQLKDFSEDIQCLMCDRDAPNQSCSELGVHRCFGV